MLSINQILRVALYRVLFVDGEQHSSTDTNLTSSERFHSLIWISTEVYFLILRVGSVLYPSVRNQFREHSFPLHNPINAVFSI